MKNMLILVLSFLSSYILFGQVSCPKWGPYVGTFYKKTNKADLCMADVMIPSEGIAPYTYTCVLQFSLGKSGGYCGLQYMDASKRRKNNNIFSIWDYPGKKQITHTYKDPTTYVDGFGNEGTGLHSHADFGWVPGDWYTLVVRRWASTDTGRTNAAFFIYDHTKNIWSHYVTFSVPEANAMLSSKTSGFLENFSDGKKTPRYSNYKSYWALLPDGKWASPDSLSAGGGDGYWDVKPFGNDGIQLFSCGPEFIVKPKVSFPVLLKDTIPQAKIIQPIQVFDAAQYFDKEKNIVYVNWITKEGTSPQLTYRAELFEAGKNEPIAAEYGYEPERRSLAISAPDIKKNYTKYYIKLSLTDIFNQPAKPFIVKLRELKE